MDIIDQPDSEEEMFDMLTKKLEKTIIKKFKGKKIPLLAEQLSDL